MALTFFTFKKRDHINVFAQSQLALSKSIFLFSLIFSPGGKRHKNEIVQDISYFAFTSFAKPGWELMHFRWRPDLSMFQYQDLMIAPSQPPLKVYLIWVSTTDYLTENLLFADSRHNLPSSKSLCYIPVGFCLVCVWHVHSILVALIFMYLVVLKNVQFVHTYFWVCILPCLEGTVSVICEFCVWYSDFCIAK